MQPDLNLADGLTVVEREASMLRNHAVAAQLQEHERQVAQNTGDLIGGECTALDARIRWIDAMARQPQGASMQDQLSSERKAVRDRQFRLRCQ